ncbi:mitochondrial intermembrane space import and assembly protein 40-B-like [Mytilus trossulus]|uniref:mitochondrial intermembrane space import and assembly protein 40-B-like n=1 Tax=Mytilus trossulus TaxID=6551 RepID=UPI003005ED9B
MSYCVQEGKDKVVIATVEDLNQPCKANIVIEKPKDEPGAILPDGSINWDCPCIARDLTGPCGYQMRQALACYTEGAASPECREKHLELQDCLQSHAGLYPWVNDEDGSVEKEAVRRAEDMISEAEKKS